MAFQDDPNIIKWRIHLRSSPVVAILSQTKSVLRGNHDARKQLIDSLIA